MQLQEFICNLVQGRKVIIILACVASGCPGFKIGEPRHIDPGTYCARLPPPPLAPEEQLPPTHQHALRIEPHHFRANDGDGATALREDRLVIMPIGALNPYASNRSVPPVPLRSTTVLCRYQNKWAIRARLIEKDFRTYSNAKGDGKVKSTRPPFFTQSRTHS